MLLLIFKFLLLLLLETSLLTDKNATEFILLGMLAFL